MLADSGQLIEMVLGDRMLPDCVHRQVRSMERSEREDSELVVKQLRSIRSRLEQHLEFDPPDCDYARVTPVGALWEFNLSDRCLAMHKSAEAYRVHLLDTTGKAEVPKADMREEPAVPGVHSWLIPAEHIKGLSGERIKSLLQLAHDPPYVVFKFSKQLLVEHAVELRPPNALDAACGGHSQWMREAVQGERVDRDIPIEALAEVTWLE